MKLGYAIEKQTYAYLRYDAPLLGFKYLEETEDSDASGLSRLIHRIKDDGIDSRSGLHLALGDGEEAAFDLN
jgi:hypothetical protein